jgi:hypothetical protein
MRKYILILIAMSASASANDDITASILLYKHNTGDWKLTEYTQPKPVTIVPTAEQVLIQTTYQEIFKTQDTRLPSLQSYSK